MGADGGFNGIRKRNHEFPKEDGSGSFAFALGNFKRAGIVAKHIGGIAQ